jgi:hypothetical protein
MLNEDTPQVLAVETMHERIGREEWDDAATHFTGGVAFRVGNLRAVHGFDEIRAYLTWRASKARWTGDHVRTKISEQDLVVTEAESRFTRRPDGAEIVIPCMNAYRFDRLEIAEWLVYGDLSPLEE